MKLATIIIPTYNESDNIEHTLNCLFEVFSTITTWKMSILVVDDSSPDGTSKIVQDLQKTHNNLHLLINKTKSGLGGAYLKGMDYAFNKIGSDVAFEFDADLSHDPKKIPEFLKKLDQGFDLVMGSRYIPGGSIPENWGWHRKFLSVVGNLFIMLVMTNFKIHDWTGGYRAIRKEVFQAVSKDLTDAKFAGYTFQVGFLNSTLNNGFKVAEVPFHFKDRTRGVSKMGPEYLKSIMIFLIKTRLEQIVKSRIFKFVTVGGLTAMLQLVALQIMRNLLPYQIAFFLAIEMAVLGNFVLSNLWTFADRKLSVSQYPLKFIQFNLASAGSILIQQTIAFVGERFIGLKDLFMVPILGFRVDTGLIFAVVGILIGMFWNFFAYSTIIWKKNKS
ncbi:MAG: glycosyltransferase [Patescibacteria group bacterium]